MICYVMSFGEILDLCYYIILIMFSHGVRFTQLYGEEILTFRIITISQSYDHETSL